MTTSEKVAYLKGLADGLGLGKETKEEKLIAAIIDTLESIASDIEDLDEITLDLGEELDAVSDDLASLESVVYDECCCDDDDYSDDDDDYEHDKDSCCHEHGRHHHGSCCHGHHGVMYEVTCPACDNTITIDEEVLNLGSIQCPSCGGTLEFDFEGGEHEGEGSENK